MKEIRLHSALRLLTMKDGQLSIQLSDAAKEVAYLAQRSAMPLASLLTCCTEKEAKFAALSLFSSKIGVTIDLVLWRESQRLTTSKQPTTITTCKKPLNWANITPSRSANTLAMKGSVIPGRGLLHTPKTERWDRATPPPPPTYIKASTNPSVFI